jgi:hypothetical protein
MLRHIILKLLFLILTIPCIAQKEGNIWVFGDSAALDFNGWNPIPILGTVVASLEPSGTISTPDGNLMFYAGTNSYIFSYYEIVVFNKFNKVIANGTGVYGHSSSSQGCLLLPSPGDTNKIYLITHKNETGSSPNLQLYYSIIDKSANSDSGAVILKNILLPGISNMSEHLQAVRHGNGIDWWVISHKGNGNQFYIYKIDSSGIQNPIILGIGSYFPFVSSVGQLKVSPNGEKLILVSGLGFIDLFDFDRCTGILSNWVPLGYSSPFDINHYYGTSFSSNSQILFVSKVDSGLYQYNLQAANITASRQLIWLKPDTAGQIGQHLLGPDGKIYIANCKPGNMSPGIFNVENMNLSVINSPDSLGLACDFQPYSFYLGGRRSFYGLPNIPDYSLLAVEGGCVVSVEEVGISKNDFVLFPNPANDELNIAVKSSHEKISVKVFNILGEEVLSSAFTNQINIDISSFTAGIYLVKLCNEKNEFVYAEKIIIQK